MKNKKQSKKIMNRTKKATVEKKEKNSTKNYNIQIVMDLYNAYLYLSIFGSLVFLKWARQKKRSKKYINF